LLFFCFAILLVSLCTSITHENMLLHACKRSTTLCRTPKQVIAEATHAQLHRAVQAGLLPPQAAQQQMRRCPLSAMPDAQSYCQAVSLAAQACIQHLQVGSSSLAAPSAGFGGWVHGRR
jgi:hypothetical protein